MKGFWQLIGKPIGGVLRSYKIEEFLVALKMYFIVLLVVIKYPPSRLSDDSCRCGLHIHLLTDLFKYTGPYYLL
jgi:hypothetical protein